MKAMLFAAGLGTRLKPFTDKHPKALAEINGRTLLEINIRYLQKFGINEVVVNVHHFAEQIIDVLEKNRGFGSDCRISDERDSILETGGGLKYAAHHFRNEKSFAAMNVDVITDLDLRAMAEAHRRSGALCTLAVMKRSSSRQFLFDEHMLLCGWTNNATGQQRVVRETAWLQPYAFSGVQVLSPPVLDMPFQGKFSLVDVYLHFADREIIKGFDHSGGIFIDAGKPESLRSAAALNL